MRGVVPDLFDLLGIIKRDERFVLVKGFKRFDRLDGIGIDDLVPDPVLPLLFLHMPYDFIHDHEFGHRCNIKTGAHLKERSDNFRI